MHLVKKVASASISVPPASDGEEHGESLRLVECLGLSQLSCPEVRNLGGEGGEFAQPLPIPWWCWIPGR